MPKSDVDGVGQQGLAAHASQVVQIEEEHGRCDVKPVGECVHHACNGEDDGKVM